MDRESFGMQMAMYTKASGRKIKRMGTVFTSTSMGLNTRATGKTICKMVKASSPGVMAASIRGVIKRG